MPGYKDIVKELVRRGAIINASNVYGDDAMQFAVSAGYWDIAAWLLLWQTKMRDIGI